MGRNTTKKVKDAKTTSGKIDIIARWIDAWEADQRDIVQRLCAAARNDDHEGIVIYSGQLRGMTENRFEAIHKMLDALASSIEEKC